MADDIPYGTLEKLMKVLSKKADIMKFGCIKLDPKIEPMMKIMSANFGESDFYQMNDNDLSKLHPGQNFMTESLKIFL